MKLKTLANQVLIENTSKIILESLSDDTTATQKQLFALGNKLKADGEDIKDDEIQAALLNALINADGKVDQIDVSDVESIKKEIKESKDYLFEDTSILHLLDTVAVVLGNAALLHSIASAFHKIGINIDEEKLKNNILKFSKFIKKITGYPAKIIEKTFTWIAKKLGFGKFGQKFAGLSGTLIMTCVFLALSVYLFPSISSGVLLIFAMSSMIGKSAEIVKLIKEIWEHIKDEISNSDLSNSLSVAAQR